ncbi:SURF1 family protein [Croceibacterium mercuriale]|uniref:SURF1 family protein n=1 Tax=Croceibacterium mercuriale TaxID=1572751 RepID=UPI000691D2EB|nr:SURF1 family protein [Croceibacterium mercuriale]
MIDRPPTSPSARARRGSQWLLAGIAILLAAICIALAIWQVQRREWKHQLIHAAETRSTAAPVPAPGPDRWPAITETDDVYRRVTATGTFRHDREALVQAVTDLGGGFWVMTPLVTDRGFTVLVNRGFVPREQRAPATRAAGNTAGPVTVTGLLRVTEPDGGFLRSNDPAASRWFSRDVPAIARAQGLGAAAPYFIDADATANPGGYPAGGLTVLSFPDNHLPYALTWAALAALCLFAAWRVLHLSR